MGWVGETEVRDLLGDRSLVDDIIGTLVEDPRVMEELADEVAGQLEDVLEGSAEFRQKLLAGVSSNPGFKRQMIAKLIEEICDN